MRINEVISEGKAAGRPIPPTVADFTQGAGDAALAAANTATFGMADKAIARGKSLANKTDYDTELATQLNRSATAQERSPMGTLAGKVAGAFVNPAFGLGAKVAPKLVSTAIGPKGMEVLQKAVTPTVGDTALNVGKKVASGGAKLGTQVVGGMGAEKIATDVAKQIDPDNPYLPESERLKELINYRMQK